MSDFTVGLDLTLADHASAPAKKALDGIAVAATRAGNQAGTAFDRMSAKVQAQTQSTESRFRSSYQAMSQARERLGIRSERVIQNEIKATEAAYQRLASSGKLSFNEQGRAAEAMKRKVTQLTNEMGKLTKEQQAQEKAAKNQALGGKIVRGAAAGAVGLAAAAYTLKAPVMQAMAFDEKIGLLANTAYAERDKTGRALGEKDIQAAITEGVKQGQTKDAVLAGLEKLIADDQVGGIKNALALSPYIAKVATGSGSGTTDVAAMMSSFIGSGYAKDVEGAKRYMGMSSAAATAGAFEKNDMAKHLPSLLPAAKAAGLTGEDGFKKLLVLLQQSRTTAGSSDEAAVNVRNLLAKLQSNDTAIDFKKAGRGDLSKYLMDQRAKGVDPLTAWKNTINQEIAKNPNLKPALQKLQGAKTDEDQTAAIESLKGMAGGQSIGKYFQDVQAKSAVFGMFNDTVEKNVNDAIGSLSGTIVERDASFIQDKAGVKTRVAGEMSDLAQMSAIDRLTPAIGRAAELMTDLSSKYPLLTGATMTAATAMSAFAGVAGLATLGLGGKIPGAGAVTGALGGAATKVGAAGAGITGALGGAATKIGAVGSGIYAAGAGTLATMGATTLGAAGAGAIAGTVGAGALVGTGIGMGINWGFEKAFTDSIGTALYNAFNGADYDPNKVSAKNAPIKVETSSKIIVEDRRVRVESTTQSPDGQANMGSMANMPM